MFRRPSWHKRRFELLEDKLYCYEKKEDVLLVLSLDGHES